MLKKVFLAAAAAMILAGATVTMAPAPAQAGKSGCHKAAKAKYPHDRKARKAYRKACKADFKASRRSSLPADLTIQAFRDPRTFRGSLLLPAQMPAYHS